MRGIVGNDTLPTGASAVKIMRRAAFAGNKVPNDGSTAASSSIPSKATSETGAENTSDEGMPSPDTASSKDRSKWTRDEKEAHYKAARERIFRDFQEAHPSEAMNVESSAAISRSNSSNGKKKVRGKRPLKMIALRLGLHMFLATLACRTSRKIKAMGSPDPLTVNRRMEHQTHK